MSKFSGLGARLHSGETSVDYIGKRRRWYAVSGLLLLLQLQPLHCRVCTLVLNSKADLLTR